ncbi:hypothetical protein [Patulibacter defluvii]|uniref:hypothetical protein n=1 Tax=Patulibacter defluvii TaxID=3095358 RepID=UPI002A74E8FD|nr:hypothetical protein [Patulibacter sp. DM4]
MESSAHGAADPVVARLIADLGRDPARARTAAQRLLELLEPDDLDPVLRLAPDAATTVLRDAWERYRHDRGRSWN